MPCRPTQAGRVWFPPPCRPPPCWCRLARQRGRTVNTLTWVGIAFAAVPLIFFMGVYFRPPKTHGEYAVLRVISSVCAGAAGVFLTGGITTEFSGDLPLLGKLTISATGAIGLFVLVWLTFPKPPEEKGPPKQEPSISISFPNGTTFRQAADAIARSRKMTLRLSGFSAEEENVALKSHDIRGVSLVEAFQRLAHLVPPNSVRPYSVHDEGSHVELHVDKGA